MDFLNVVGIFLIFAFISGHSGKLDLVLNSGRNSVRIKYIS